MPSLPTTIASAALAAAARRRRTFAVVLGLAAAAAGASLPGAAGAEGSQVPATWDVAGVGPHGRSLELVYLTGGCLSATPETTVTETAASITLEVTLTDSSGPGIACPQFLRYATSTVRLSAPIAGRVILGRPKPALTGYPGALINPGGGALRVRVPRLVGFAPSDARHTLALYGLSEHRLASVRRHGLARVISQAPAPGASSAQRGTITIRLSRPAP